MTIQLLNIGGQYDDGRDSCACGDYSLGAEPSNRAMWQVRPGGPFVTVTETYYVTGRRDSDVYDMTPDDVSEVLADRARWESAAEESRGPEPEDIRYGVDCQTEWILHTDRDDVGGSELASDYDYEGGSALSYSSLESAEAEARRLARAFDPADYAPQHWAPVARELRGEVTTRVGNV